MFHRMHTPTPNFMIYTLTCLFCIIHKLAGPIHYHCYLLARTRTDFLPTFSDTTPKLVKLSHLEAFKILKPNSTLPPHDHIAAHHVITSIHLSSFPYHRFPRHCTTPALAREPVPCTCPSQRITSSLQFFPCTCASQRLFIPN